MPSVSSYVRGSDFVMRKESLAFWSQSRDMVAYTVYDL